MKRRRKAEAILRQAREARRVDAGHYYQLTGCVVQYTSINIILWTIFSIFAAAHALLVNALIVILEKGDKHPLALVMVSMVGVLAALAWVALLHRTIRHLVWYQALVTRIEDDPELRINEAHRMFPNDERPLGGYGPPAKTVMRWCTWITAVLWVATFVYFVLAAWPIRL